MKRLPVWLTVQLKVAMLNDARGLASRSRTEEEECVETTLACRPEPQILDRSDHRGGACPAFAARSALG